MVEPTGLHSPPEGLHEREGPGWFRQYDIPPFTDRMTPPPFPAVPTLVTDWLRDAVEDRPTASIRCCSLLTSTLPSSESIHPRREPESGSAGDKPLAGPAPLSAGRHRFQELVTAYGSDNVTEQHVAGYSARVAKPEDPLTWREWLYFRTTAVSGDREL